MSRKLQKAVELYTNFHWGKFPRRADKVKIPLTDTFVFLGKLLGVIYLSDKDGAPKPYVHFFGGEPEPFRLACRNGQVHLEKVRRVSLSRLPGLLSDEEGKTLYIANFRGRVEERGIVG